ncbi:MAG TPA: 2-C-methyl-D-erythritol 2,4-cyclodiphosphate synthase, partial [Erysipelotrichaceae bacterium]|nr:2-C-methyl-D-erythritol 2,4-cyclodiphosphate synthase [Erysipelotrichaceae bacterium]
MRIGQSSDIHRLVAGRKLILGGVEIESDLGLLGHSDADALCHAVGEAVLGALALGDLGRWFPDTDPKWEGVSSLIILKECGRMMKEKGYVIGNVDSLVMIEKPKMA